jgi:2-keto-4-pentenoate hydratase
VLKQPLPARVLPYSPQEIDAAIGSTHIALELIQSRYANDSGASFLDQLADGLFNQGLWLGPKIHGKETSEFELRYHVGSAQVSATNASESESTVNSAASEPNNMVLLAGKHPNQAPRLPIYWLVNFLSAHQIDLAAGQMIITGSYAGVLEFPFDTPVQLHFGNLGQIDLVFSSR